MSLFITIGCPGAGKSRWADGLPSCRLRLERDRFRECLFGSRRAYHESALDPAARSEVITQAMLSAMIYWPQPRWAVTDTGLDLGAVKPFLDFAKRGRHDVHLFVFNTSLDTLLSRNMTREEAHRVPEEILRERYDVFCDPAAWWRGEEWTHKRTVTPHNSPL